ncbi:hypothetical protein ACIBL3_43625 [Kribbella sp. NPDC050124]|uniref:hypothetical protein n=1 Tax=Kribbella sp. NPDC050124 TaxID=3364114 RepID=UPI0037B64E57
MMDDKLRRSIRISTKMKYFSDKIHGDELVSSDGRVFTEERDEWLDAVEVGTLLRNNPDLPLVMVDRSEPMPVVYELLASGVEGWSTVVEPRYISIDGLPPTGTDVHFLAHLWADSSGDKLLLLELEC